VVGVPEIIGVEKGGELSAGDIQSGIPGSTRSAKGSSEEADTREVRLNQLRRPIRRSIVGNNDFSGLDSLAKSCANRRTHEGLGVSTCDDDRDVHHAGAQ
jgi:hypothetical protein